MKILSLDIGLKRIGVAICQDSKSGIVTPINAVIRHNRKQASHDINGIINEWNIDLLVVGLPKDGSKSEEMQRRITHFVGLLNLQIDVVYYDESYSSFEASELMVGVTKNKKDGKSDSIAAMLILQRYLFNQIS